MYRADARPDVDRDVVAIRVEFDELDVAEKLWLTDVAIEVRSNGYDVNLTADPSPRRLAVAKVALSLAQLRAADDPARIGAALARLTLADARRLASLLGQFVEAER